MQEITEETVKDLPSSAIVEMALCEQSLLYFIQKGWHVLEPTTKFVSGWHLEAICEHLEACTSRQIRNLIINIPPRHMKSLSVSVFWPCWEWIQNPSSRWLFSSYAQELSTRDSLKCRRLLTSEWFTSRWGGKFHLTGDQNQKTRFENNKTGYRLATSVSGLVTGEGGDYIICVPEGYYITTKSGDYDIKDIVECKLPVRILSYNHETKQTELKEIEAYEQRETEEIIEIDFGDDLILECTPDHLVYVQDQGYKKAELLKDGDVVLYENN